MKILRSSMLFLSMTLMLQAPATAQEWSSGAPVTPNWSSTIQWVPPYDTDDTHPADAYEQVQGGTVFDLHAGHGGGE